MVPKKKNDMTTEKVLIKTNDLKERNLVLDKVLALVSQAFKLFNEYEERVNSSSAETPQGLNNKAL